MKVTLKSAHQHAGHKYAADSEIDVPLHDALWLRAEDKIKESLAAIGAEVKKFDAKDQDVYKAALDRAAAAEAARKADAK